MGYVDTQTRFTHYNSYRLEPGEELFGAPFDVEFFSAINSQAQVICKDATSEGAMYMTWLAEDGSKLGRDEFEFDVTGRWVRPVWVNEPPEHAVRAMWSVKNTHETQAWNLACAMTSAGEMAGAFDPSLAGQVSLLTASGLYAGTVTANQVETGLLRSIDGLAYFDLDKPEIVMNGTKAVWKASPENPLRLEDRNGNLIGGLVSLPNGQTALVTTALANEENMSGGLAYIGQAEETRGAGIHFEREGHSFSLRDGVYGLNSGGFAIYVDGKRRAEWFETGAFSVYGLEGGQGRLQIFESGSASIKDASGNDRLQILSTGQILLTDANNIDRLKILESGSVYITDQNGDYLYWADSAGTIITSADNKQRIGCDATGPFYTQDGVQSYLHTQTKTGAQNFDNYLTQGTWFFNDSAHTNSPQGNSGGILRVTTDGNFVLQEYLTYNDAWQRRKLGTGAWNAWFSVK